VKEGIIVLGGVLLAAWVLSRMPKVKAWVGAQSLQVRDQSGQSTTFY
jgi:flagellar biogenesis protein FliO